MSATGAFRGSLVERSKLNISPDRAKALNSLVGQGTEFVIGSPSTGAWTDLSRVTGMSGRELSVELRRRRPDLPIIIMSGYTGETYPVLEALPPGVGYLEKPFSLPTSASGFARRSTASQSDQSNVPCRMRAATLK